VGEREIEGGTITRTQVLSSKIDKFISETQMCLFWGHENYEFVCK